MSGRDPGCLIVDDVDAAMARLTDFGRSIMRDAAAGVRDSVHVFATRRGWSVVRYEAFAGWAAARAVEEDRDWVSLDPLYDPRDKGRIARIRLSRRFMNGSRASFDDTGSVDDTTLNSNNVGLIEDAASSGSTIRYLQRLATDRGGQIRSVVLCAASEHARQVATRAGSLNWSAYVPGDWRVVHLRDGCPFLPFSGRPSGERIALESPGASIDRRIQATLVEGSLWQVLQIDRDIRRTLTEARSSIVSTMRIALGRVPIVRDLVLLGNDVPATTASPDLPLLADSPLEA